MPNLRLRSAVALLALVATLALLFHRSSLREAGIPPASSTTSPGPGERPATATNVPACPPTNAPASTPFADARQQRARHDDALAKAASFTNWLTDWRRADSDPHPLLAARGRELAAARREGLKYLIETDPKRALELAVPVGLRAELPAEVRAQLEQRIDARGDFEVAIACLGTETRTLRTATIGGTRYDAFVFGRREPQGTKHGLPLHGIALDGALALDETPYRLLDDSEKSAHSLPFEQTALFVGTDIVPVTTTSEFEALTARLIAAESGAGPELISTAADSGDPVLRIPGTAAVTKDAAWITGNKRVLWLKLEFSDDPGEPVSDADINTNSALVNTFYDTSSYGKTTMTFTILPTLLRLPKDKAHYNSAMSTTSELRDDAKAAAKAYDAANGNTGAYDPDRFDRWILVFKRVPAYTFGGLASVGGTPVWLNNNAAASTAGHELGHNQSLDHSHSWLPSGTSPIGPGTHVEYGDVFDRMGSSGSSANNFFNVSQKFKLGYLDATSITTVTTAGTYRLTRHDHRDATGIRALRVGASNVEYEYWIEHRRLGPTALTAQQVDRLQNGVLLHWGSQKLPRFAPGPGSYLLDMTPGTAAGTFDAPLRIGEVFTDPDAGITVKPIAVGGTAPNEYIDVQVSFGAIDGNHNPVIVADAPTATISARTNVVFAASATDPDGDSVYYRWDFGDGKFQPNLGTVTERFAKGGSYPVTVSAHDGKGGIAVKTYTVNVVDPLITWTHRASGLTTNLLYDVTSAGNQFVAVGINNTVLTSPDGATWTKRTFPTGISLTGVAYNGARYVVSGYRFSNPTDKGLAAYSADGVTWTTVNISTGLAQFWSVAYGAGRFVMVGDSGLIYTSIDGATWSAAASGVTNTLRRVTFIDGLFLACGDNGRLVTSTDGVTWTNRSLASSGTFYSIAHYNGTWFVSGFTNQTFKSSDTIAWSRVATPAGTISSAIFDLIPSSGVLFGANAGGNVVLSEDGQTWSTVSIDTATGASTRAAAEGKGLIVTVGANGAIYTATTPTTFSPPLAAPSMRLEGASLKVSVGRKNIIAAGGAGYSQLELYANGTKVSEISGSSGVFTWTPAAIGNYALAIRGVDASGASALSASYPAQAGLANWNWHNPNPEGADLTGAVRIDGKWWIVGNTGNFFTLDGGGNFTPVDFATTQNLTGIGYANGRFVVTAPSNDGGSREPIGEPWVSSDGFSWTALYTATIELVSLNQVFYLGDQWVAPGNGTVLTSADGLSWNRQLLPFSNSVFGAALGNNLYVVVGAGGKITTSPNGVTWTERTSGVTTDLRKVAFNNGTFVAAGLSGVILSSPDGATWTRRTSGVTNNLYAAAVIKGSFVVAGDGGVVLTSADGTAWTPATIENRTSNFRFAVGAEGEGVLLGTAGEVYTATSAASYQRVAQGTHDSHNNVIYAGGKFVAVGQAVDPLNRNAVVTPVMVSSDGTNWTRATANSAFNNLNDVTYGQSRFVAVGDSSGVFTSTDGVNWTKSTFTISSTLTCVAAGPNAFVAASSGQSIYSSPDGATWTQRLNGQVVAFRGATYGNGRFVVVGDSGAIRTSTDGTNWTTITSGTTAQLLNVSYFNDVGFLAAGATGTMLSSTDGLTWRLVETGISDTIFSIAQTPVGFLAPAGTAGTMLMSLDGINWSIGTVPVDRAVRGVAASDKSIVAVGDTGALLSYDIVDPTPAPTIASQPLAQSVVNGTPASLAVSAINASGGAYQWFKDGVPIVGANAPLYSIAAVTPATAGAYTVVITTPTGSTTSAPANLTFGAVADPGRLINLSILTALTGASDSFTFGVVVGGAGTSGGKALLVRAAGPSLTALGVTGVLDDPKLEFFTGSTQVGENDNWGGAAAISAVMAQVGAFSFSSPTSRDAAISLPSLASGANSAKISGTGAGTVIAELYDATPTNAFTASTPRLVNVSVLKNIGGGVTAGFVIGGSSSRTVLIRAIGPTLTGFGVSGAVADPQLTLFRGAAQIGANDNWGGSAALSGAFTQVGAFALADGSKDAALLATLEPGSYTVQVSGVGGTTGVALVEVYEVP